MAQQFWLSLPVQDVKRSIAFFTKLGFKFNMGRTNDNMACMLMGEKNVVLMLCDEPTYKSFIGNNEIVDAKKASEVLLSVDALTKERVDEMAKKAVDAGGTTNHKPYTMEGWLYGCIFNDLDGHRWNVLYMDMSKMPK